MDYTGGIDIEQLENGSVSIEPVAQAAQQHSSTSSEPDPQIGAPTSVKAPHSSFLPTGVPPKRWLVPWLLRLLSTSAVDPPLPARTYPLGAGGPYNHSPWPNNSTISRTPLPSSTWPPPPNWAPHAPYNGTNFSLPYSGHPVPSYVNIPPPSHYRPPPTQPSVLLNPREYVWNPSLGPVGDPPPPNAPAASPGPPNALDEFHAAVEKFGEGWQAVAEEKEHLQKSQAAMFAAEKITRSQKDIETNPDPTLLQKRLIDTVEDERLQSVGLENPARIHKGRSTPSVFPINSLKRRKLEEDPSQQL